MYLITQLVNVKNVKQSDIRKYYLYSSHWSTSISPFEAARCILRRQIYQLVNKTVVVSCLVNHSVIKLLSNQSVDINK